ncbi:endoglin [Platysternon megacephalum]|uniref:Endoglin n=1 Tax=Platysternon megacephalum TaxID=55544 RepID=A0A4D9ETB0_9SAUR|nr:endoglin [Platysternon megacephalum]
MYLLFKAFWFVFQESNSDKVLKEKICEQRSSPPQVLQNFLHHLCLTNDRDTAVLPKSLSLEPLQTGNLLLLHNQHSLVAAFFSS